MAVTRITRVPIMPLGMVNAFIAHTPDGAVLIDTGLPGSEDKVAAALKRVGLSFPDISLIVVTHGHIDHAGNAARLRELTGAPILIQAQEAPFCARDAEMTFCPTGAFGRLFLRTGVAQRPYPGFAADIVLADGETLDTVRFGVPGTVRATPGHTPGSLSFNLSGGEVVVGDLLASGVLLGGIAFTGRPKRPPFEEDPAGVAASLQGLLDSGATRFHLGHGGPIRAAAVGRHIAALRRIVRSGG